MRKVLVIAVREYRAAVRTKAFVISLVLMPVLMGGSIGIQVLLKKIEDVKDKRFAVIDRTPGEKILPMLKEAAKERTKSLLYNSEGKQIHGAFLLERIEPSDAIDQQRLDLSRSVEKGEFEGFLEIGANILDYSDAPAPPSNEPPQDSVALRYQSNKATDMEFARWAERVVNALVERERCSAANLPADKVRAIQQPVLPKIKGLSKRNSQTGAIEEPSDEKLIANIMAPAMLIALMFLMIMIGAAPAMQSVLEEKMQRIAEVLLGSVTPFQLMFGKLLGMVAVSLTVAAVYLTGAYVVAFRYGLTEFLSPGLLAWFLFFLVLAVLMYGSLFIAVGAAATDLKESQSLLLPIMLVAVMPMLLLGPIIQEPNGLLARVCSFIPTATPMLMVARIGLPPGVDWWQPVVGAILVLAATLACVWAAGRIFRVGILMSGKSAKFSDLVKWVARG
jgi:ABC-2 type transport system permease protein